MDHSYTASPAHLITPDDNHQLVCPHPPRKPKLTASADGNHVFVPVNSSDGSTTQLKIPIISFPALPLTGDGHLKRRTASNISNDNSNNNEEGSSSSSSSPAIAKLVQDISSRSQPLPFIVKRRRKSITAKCA